MYENYTFFSVFIKGLRPLHIVGGGVPCLLLHEVFRTDLGKVFGAPGLIVLESGKEASFCVILSEEQIRKGI